MLTAVIAAAAYLAYFLCIYLPELRSRGLRRIWPCLALLLLAAAMQFMHETGRHVPSPAPAISGFISAWFAVP